jgi:hypothetical protein
MRLAQFVLIVTLVVTTFLIWLEHQVKIVH